MSCNKCEQGVIYKVPENQKNATFPYLEPFECECGNQNSIIAVSEIRNVTPKKSIKDKIKSFLRRRREKKLF